jgi:hypothetical protein
MFFNELDTKMTTPPPLWADLLSFLYIVNPDDYKLLSGINESNHDSENPNTIILCSQPIPFKNISTSSSFVKILLMFRWVTNILALGFEGKIKDVKLTSSQLKSTPLTLPMTLLGYFGLGKSAKIQEGQYQLSLA